MSKFLDLTLKYLSYDSATQSNDPADSDRITSRIQDNTIAQVARQQLAIPASASNQVVSLPANPSTYLLVFCDQALTMIVDGNSYSIAPQTAGVKCLAFFLRGNITSLAFTNAGSVSANIDVIAAV